MKQLSEAVPDIGTLLTKLDTMVRFSESIVPFRC